MPRSSLELAFDQYLALLGEDLPPHEVEYAFAKHLRRSDTGRPYMFRFDFAWLDKKVAVEVDGGSWSGGRHTRGKGFEDDCQKLNLATVLGFRTLRFTSTMLKNDPVGCIEQVRQLLASS